MLQPSIGPLNKVRWWGDGGTLKGGREKPTPIFVFFCFLSAAFSLRTEGWCEFRWGWSGRVPGVYINAQHSRVLTQKSSSGLRGSLPKVLHGCERPWFKSPSSHNPKRPLLISNWLWRSFTRVKTKFEGYLLSSADCQAFVVAFNEIGILSCPRIDVQLGVE